MRDGVGDELMIVKSNSGSVVAEAAGCEVSLGEAVDVIVSIFVSAVGFVQADKNTTVLNN